MKPLRAAFALGIVAVVAVTQACGSAEEGGGAAPPSEASAAALQGLSIEEMDEASGKLVLKFEKDGRSIRFDLRLGPKMALPPSAEELEADPELTTFEADAQILDVKGQPFVTQIAGDSFMDSSWTFPKVENVDEAQRVNDFEMVRQALPALRGLDVPAGLDQLRRSAIRIARGIEPNPVPGKALSFDAEKGVGDVAAPGLRPLGTIEWGPSSVRWWDFQVKKKSAFGANHSSVLLRGWTSSYTRVYVAASCNHGTCATDSAMSVHCTYPGWLSDDGTHSRYFMTEGCSTPYNWGSGPGSHNCNDDSELQVKAIKSDSFISRTGGSCGAIGSHYWAPGC